jgi:hypothetical protein
MHVIEMNTTDLLMTTASREERKPVDDAVSVDSNTRVTSRTE